MPVEWKPCPGESAEPGASGSPPMIVELSLPTCAYLDSPTVKGTLRASDQDGDVQILKATFYAGMHINESELQLDDAGRSGNDWAGTFSVVVAGSTGGMVMEGSDDVRMKVTDRGGAQSAPFCNTISIVR